MKKILAFLSQIDCKIIFPIHPRTRKMLKEYELENELINIKNLVLMNPVGYFEMVSLLKGCRLVISDSGGTSKEASFLGKKCFYILNLDIWPELSASGYVQMVFNMPAFTL